MNADLSIPGVARATRVRYGVLGFACALSMITYLDRVCFGTVAPYSQFNVGIAREFLLPGDTKPTTLRFDVVNLFDSIYLIRDGSGIGVFAPQFGPRRGYYAGITKKF